MMVRLGERPSKAQLEEIRRRFDTTSSEGRIGLADLAEIMDLELTAISGTDFQKADDGFKFT